jgi:hypothetical protein
VATISSHVRPKDFGVVEDGWPRPVSSLTSVTIYNSTTRLNDGIFTVSRFSVATAQIGMCFRSYVYGGIFDNQPGGFFYLHVEQLVFVFFFFFCGLGRPGEGRIVCAIEAQ